MNGALPKRNSALDVARIIAILAVIMIHCSADFVTGYEIFTNEFILGNIFDSLSRIAVPLFLMISGSLFLDEHKEVTLKGILSKNVKSLAFITIIWSIIYSLIYNVVFPLQSGGAISIKNVLLSIIKGHYHMWYLYMIIGLYIITPFLKRIVCTENVGMVRFFIVFSFVVQFLMPAIDKVVKRVFDTRIIMQWVDKFELDFFGGFITYYLVGWYIVHVGIKQKWLKYLTYLSGIGALAVMIIYVHFTGDYDNVYEEIGVFAFFYSVSVFLALNEMKLNFSDRIAKILAEFSKLSFGVYIIHVLILTLFGRSFNYNGNPFIYIFTEFVIVTSVSFLISFIISKIPVIKKIIKA